MMTKDNDQKKGAEHLYRVCCWCGNDSVDDPRITWRIKSKTKKIGLCDACAQEIPELWSKMLIKEECEDEEAL